ncbi:MAG: formimidoylglutamase [Planctomycetes bacterium]|nr:formimidoylglutamase [Planctomycetota bacterium]
MPELIRKLTRSDAVELVRRRAGEKKLAETVDLCGDAEPWREALARSSAPVAVLGIPSDIGVRANFGKIGSASLWSAARRQFLAMQDNATLRGDSILLLGELIVDDLMREAAKLDPGAEADLHALRAHVAKVDERVAEASTDILKSGKLLIAVGGGHENAYGLIKGLSQAAGEPAGCINIDAHADLRSDEGRHSGNSFSAALRDKFLERYFVLGLQEPFINNEMWERLQEEPALRAVTLETIRTRGHFRKNFVVAPHLGASEEAVKFVKKRPLALEMDLDAITGVPASAATPAGLAVEEAREMLRHIARRRRVGTFHVCEGIPGESDAQGVGRLAALMMADVAKISIARRS